MEKQKPSVGRVVHFHSLATENGVETLTPQAAFVVAVHTETCVSVVAWNEWGTANAHRSVTQGDGAGQWNWPARV